MALLQWVFTHLEDHQVAPPTWSLLKVFVLYLIMYFKINKKSLLFPWTWPEVQFG